MTETVVFGKGRRKGRGRVEIYTFRVLQVVQRVGLEGCRGHREAAQGSVREEDGTSPTRKPGMENFTIRSR